VKAGIGVDNIDVEAATRLGVLVVNTPLPADYIGVAEGAVARIISLAKKLLICDRNVKRDKWLSDYDELRGVYLKGKTLGIIGLGRIGSYITKLMRPWNLKMIAYDPYIKEEKAELLDVDLVDLDTVLKESDFLTINATVTPETKRMINEEALRKMKRTAFLINTARGAIIDENALYKALKERWIAGAALDVFDKEPPTGSPILSPEISDTILLSPHVSGLSLEMEKGLTLQQVTCCMQALEGEPPHSTVNPEAIQKWKEKFR
jgi:D-3-phosphoglycerate dehydrogenase